MLSLKKEDKVRISVLTALIQNNAGNSNQYHRARKGNKNDTDQKGRNKTVLI